MVPCLPKASAFGAVKLVYNLPRESKIIFYEILFYPGGVQNDRASTVIEFDLKGGWSCRAKCVSRLSATLF